MLQSILAYVRVVQRRSCELGLSINLFEGPVFKDLEKGFFAALNNVFVEQQSNGAQTKCDNFFNLNDTELISKSDFCIISNSEGSKTVLFSLLDQQYEHAQPYNECFAISRSRKSLYPEFEHIFTFQKLVLVKRFEKAPYRHKKSRIHA